MTSSSNSAHSSSRTLSLWLTICIGIVVITAVNTYFAFRSIAELSAKQQSVTNTTNVITTIKDLHNAVLLAESGQRGYLLTENKDYLSHYHLAIEGLQSRIDLVFEIRTELPEQKERILQLIKLIKRKKSELIKTVDLAESDEEIKAVRQVFTGLGRRLYLQIYALFSDIEATELELQARLYADMIIYQQQTRDKLVISSGISIALVIMLLFIFQRSRKHDAAHRLELENQNRLLEEKVAERTRELTLYSDELSRSNRELEDFAFVASHDLQEPLRKIQAFANRIQNIYQDRLDEKGIDYLQRLNNAASRMSLLITDLLEFSRIKTRGKDFVSVNLKAIIDGIIDDMEISIAESNATFEVGELPTLQADENQIHRLFLNIISNAVKFRQPEQAPHIAISWSIEKHSALASSTDIDWHTIRIRDNGIGFSQEYADKIFLPFQRLHGRSEYEGTGIGLAICRRIAERHGGNISAQSKQGIGTEFIITIPVESINFDRPIN